MKRLFFKTCHVLAVIAICLGVLRLRVVLAQAKALHFADQLPQREILLKWQKPVDKDPNVVPARKSYDINKLAKAVAKHETGDCTARRGSARVNNCFGI